MHNVNFATSTITIPPLVPRGQAAAGRRSGEAGIHGELASRYGVSQRAVSCSPPGSAVTKARVFDQSYWGCVSRPTSCARSTPSPRA